MNAKLDYNQIMVDASNRLHAIINACINKDNDSIICNTCSSMYSCEKDIPAVKEEKERPVLDQDLCFSYRGYKFELSACNIISTREQMLGLTNENFMQQFPHGVFTDRYVCWMQGHKDCEGHTKEEVDDLEDWAPSVYPVPGAWSWGAESDFRVCAEVDDPEDWAPSVYLVPGAWSWGAESDLRVCAEVNPIILEAIDKFLETFKE